MPNPHLTPQAEGEIRKIVVNTAWEVKLLHNNYDVSTLEDSNALHDAIEKEFDAAVAALARLILRERADELYGVQVYTDPSHQKMSPFTRLKTADKYINERLAQLQPNQIEEERR